MKKIEKYFEGKISYKAIDDFVERDGKYYFNFSTVNNFSTWRNG